MARAPASPKSQLASLGLRAKKHFGQNFLADAVMAARIAELATTPAGGSVVELGAGLGSLTVPLLERASRVVAIERDRDLVPHLGRDFADAISTGQLRVLEEDAKAADFLALLAGGPRPHVVAGNLPYQITGPLLEKTVAIAQEVDRVVYLLQLEVADRIAAAADSERYGALSVFVQAQFVPSRAFVIRRGAFYPQPEVDSAVLVLEPRRPPITAETPAFRAVVSAAFQQRRKKLRNAWRGVLGADDVALGAAAERSGVDLEARGETLTVTQFAAMARELEHS